MDKDHSQDGRATPPRPSAIEAARQYLSLGWQPVRLDGKRPLHTDWQKREYTPEEAAQTFGPGCNVGLNHGPISADLVDVDLDWPEAVTAARHLLPPTPMRHGRRSAGLSHWWYVSPDLKTTHLNDPSVKKGEKGPDGQPVKGGIIDVLGAGTQSMVPPSVHPNGEPIEWARDNKFTPAKVRARDLLTACQRLAAVALLARNWAAGGRSELAMACGGWWAKEGVPVETAETWMRAVCDAANDEELQGRVKSVQHSYETLEAGKPVAGYGKLAEYLDERVLRQVSTWLGLKGPATGGKRGGSGGERKPGLNKYAQELQDALELDDVGNAARLIKRFGDDLLYCHKWKSWLLWDDNEGRWRIDEKGRALLMAAKVAAELRDEAMQEEDPDRRAWLLKHGIVSRNTTRLRAMLDVAAAAPTVAITPTDLDTHPCKLNVLNGTLDLSPDRLLEGGDPLVPSAREDRLSRMAPVVYDPGAKRERFDRFLTEIFGEDRELIAFMQRLAGYLLIAGNPEEVVPIWHGGGGNGKSKLFEVLMRMLGDYSATLATQVLMGHESGGNNELYALATLRGVRMVVASESEKEEKLKDRLVKSLSGGDEVMAREPFGAPFSFKPEFTPILVTNHKPVIHDLTESIWRRLLLIPFLIEVPPEQRDTDLGQKLAAEIPGILNWCIDGLIDYYTLKARHGRGLQPPATVTSSTKDYRTESDILAPFLEDCTIAVPAARVAKGVLWGTYETWCKANAAHEVQNTTFRRCMLAHDWIGEAKSGSVRYWTGLDLANPLTEDLAGGGYSP